MTTIGLDALNAATEADFIAALGDIFEDAPWVAERAAAQRPFETITTLHEAMLAAVRSAPDYAIIAFLRGHPELGGTAALAGTMGAASTAEQAGLGLQRAAADIARLSEMNAAYRSRHGIPFILCVRRHSRASLMRNFAQRIERDPVAEREAALAEIAHITRLRLVERVAGPGAPIVHGSLTTHVLDTALGRPAPGIAVELFEIADDVALLLTSTVTNADGRTPRPLLADAPLRIGVYELRFHVGAYFAARLTDDPPFLDVVPVRFGIAEPEAHYHVPLLASPGAFSSYRGS